MARKVDMRFEAIDGSSRTDLPPGVLVAQEVLEEWQEKSGTKSCFIYCDDPDTAESFVTALISYLNKYDVYCAPSTITYPQLPVMENPKNRQVVIHNYHNHKPGTGRAWEATLLRNSATLAEIFHFVILHSNQEHSIAKDVLAPEWECAVCSFMLYREQWIEHQLKQTAAAAPMRDKIKV